MLGQLVFALYVALYYGGALARGDVAHWNRVLPHGYVAGDPAGNALVGAHLFCAVLLMFGGALQLVPRLRRAAPALHRWNGRVFVSAAMLASIAGLLMMATRGAIGGPAQQVALALNALVILACGGMAWRHARARRFDAHRRWALRLFLAVGGVWFFRLGLMLWIAIHRGPVGFDPESFTGPFLSVLSFAQFLLPLAVLELYFRAQSHGGPRAHWAMAALLLASSIALVCGIGAATAMLWLPRL